MLFSPIIYPSIHLRSRFHPKIILKKYRHSDVRKKSIKFTKNKERERDVRPLP
jgi:hypothetical protein